MSDLSQMVVAGKIIGGFDKEVGEIGMMATVKKMLARTKSKLEITFDGEETKQVLKNGPVIVTVNHPHQSDVMIIMAALPDRNDWGMIVQSTLLGLGKEIDKKMIPVFVDHQKDSLSFWKKSKYIFFAKLHTHKPLSREEGKEMNRRGLIGASSRLDKNELVIIFPTGGSKDGRWFSGVGHMIKGSKNPGLKIVMANIEGSSSWDYFRLIPGVSRLLPTIKVRFSLPIEVNEYRKMKAKEIALKLETKYEEWLKN
jgi:1-acyl-sn-glycerol-3-phosphate acyltransferase